jgi:hypothetical protein
MKRGAAFWGLALGGGAVAIAALRRSASASSTTPSKLHHLSDIASGTEPAAEPPEATPPASASIRPALNRRADDGPPIYLSDDVEALARVIQSEVGRGTLAERLAIGWCARNRAAARSLSIARLVCSPCGKSSGNARPFSTMLPGTTASRELAAVILASPQSEDPTQGATNCFEPNLQNRLHRAGRPGHRLDARGVRHCWLRGLDYYGSVGQWDLFGPKAGRGAREVPAEWDVGGINVCCSGDRRAECRGKAVGTPVEAVS